MQEYIIQDEAEYLARIELHEIEGQQLPFLHLDFKKWSPRSFRKLLFCWSLFRRTAKGNFYALSNGADDDKWRKFVECLGFEYFMNVNCPDGKNRRCFVSKQSEEGCMENNADGRFYRVGNDSAI
jgi:hypothetical protein